jgi:hypothetical protein
MEPTCLTNSEWLPQLSEAEAMQLAIYQRTVLENPFIPHKPPPKQAEFLLKAEREALYGRAAGGGKSDALLMGALQWVEVPSYSALLLRRTYSDLAKAGALMDRAKEWLYHTAARPKDGGKKWVFPSGATLEFGYLDAETDKYQYQSAEYQYIAFDELTPSIPSILAMPKAQDLFDERNQPRADWLGRQAERFLDELEWYGNALMTARRGGVPY